MKKAIIYRPAKSATQSGKLKTKKWIMTFQEQKPQYADPLMGWIGQSTTENQIKLKFESKEEAITYAQQKGIVFEVKESHQASFKRKAYADNFL